MRRSFLMAEK